MILLDTNVISEPMRVAESPAVAWIDAQPLETLCLAAITVAARASGLAIGTSDGYIAAIASAHGFSVATRDTSHFQAAGLTVINPWKL